MDRKMSEMAAQMGQHREEMQDTSRAKTKVSGHNKIPPLNKLINKRKRKL